MSAETALEPAGVYRKNPDTVTRTISGETFIVAIRGKLASLDRMYVLDEVGRLVWDALDGKNDVAAIVAQVTDVFEVDRDTAHRDVVGFLEKLRELELVQMKGDV